MVCTGVAVGLIIGVTKFPFVVVVVVVVGMGHSYESMVCNGKVRFSDDEAIKISSDFVVVVVVIVISISMIQIFHS